MENDGVGDGFLITSLRRNEGRRVHWGGRIGETCLSKS